MCGSLTHRAHMQRIYHVIEIKYWQVSVMKYNKVAVQHVILPEVVSRTNIPILITYSKHDQCSDPTIWKKIVAFAEFRLCKTPTGPLSITPTTSRFTCRGRRSAAVQHHDNYDCSAESLMWWMDSLGQPFCDAKMRSSRPLRWPSRLAVDRTATIQMHDPSRPS